MPSPPPRTGRLPVAGGPDTRGVSVFIDQIPETLVANHKDAVKRAVQAVKRRARNRTHRTRMRNQVADLRTALEGKDKDKVQAEFRDAVSVIQALQTKGIIHRNQAIRRVKRLAAAVKAHATK